MPESKRQVVFPSQADELFHIPRGGTYKVLKHGVQVKDGDVWANGCCYEDTKTGQVYCRAYSRFTLSDWIYYKEIDNA